MNHTIRHHGAKLFALLTTLAVILSTAIIQVPAAMAATNPTLTVTAPSGPIDPSVANTVTVQGANFVSTYDGPVGPTKGIYLGVMKAGEWTPGTLPNMEADFQFVKFVSFGDGAGDIDSSGSFSTTLSIPAGALDADQEYVVSSFAIHQWSMIDRSLDAVGALAVEAPAPADPSDGSGDSADAADDTPADGPDGGSDPGSDDGGTDGGIVDPTDPVVEPELTIEANDYLKPAGDTITVRGTGYNPDFANRHGGGKAGVYVQIGWLKDNWRPSKGAASADRANAYSAWIADAANTSAPDTWTIEEDGTASFELTFEISKADLDAKKLDGARLAVFTVGGGGVVQPENELSVDIVFVKEPTLTVSPTDNLNPDGDTITVVGTGFNPDYANTHGRPDTELGQAGVYVQIGWLKDKWRPSKGAVSADRANAYNTWVADTVNRNAPDKWTIEEDGTASFELTFEISKAELDAAKLDSSRLAVFTIGGGGVVQPENELSVFFSFVGDDAPGGGNDGSDGSDGVENPTPETNPGDNGSNQTVGSMQWSIKSSFHNYLNTIAHGHFETQGVSMSGRTMGFTQISSSYDEKTGTGTIRYGGSVATIGHGGQMNYLLQNWRIRIDSKQHATLLVDYVNRGPIGEPSQRNVELVRLYLGQGSKTVMDNGSIRYVGVPTIAVNADRVFGNYPAGTAFDAISFTIGVDGKTPIVSSNTTVANANAEAEDTEETDVTSGALLNLNELVCPVLDAELRWGFKEQFRSYLTGIANGEWTLDDNVDYFTPQFAWTQGTGSMSEDGSELILGFDGSVRFTGHGGVLNTRISNPTIQLENGEAILYVDIEGDTQDGQTVESERVPFAKLDLSQVQVLEGAGVDPDMSVSSDGEAAQDTGDAEAATQAFTVLLENIPVTLTDPGAKAFGTYPAGTELDPITLQFSSSPDCATNAAGSDDVEDIAATAGEPEIAHNGGAGSDATVVWISLAVLAALAAIAGGVVAFRRRGA